MQPDNEGLFSKTQPNCAISGVKNSTPKVRYHIFHKGNINLFWLITYIRLVCFSKSGTKQSKCNKSFTKPHLQDTQLPLQIYTLSHPHRTPFPIMPQGSRLVPSLMIYICAFVFYQSASSSM